MLKAKVDIFVCNGTLLIKIRSGCEHTSIFPMLKIVASNNREREREIEIAEKK